MRRPCTTPVPSGNIYCEFTDLLTTPLPYLKYVSDHEPRCLCHRRFPTAFANESGHRVGSNKV